jgi:hypothetical protein
LNTWLWLVVVAVAALNQITLVKAVVEQVAY